MQQERLEVQKRGVFGKGPARELRRSGRIPAVLYGRGQDVLPLQIGEHYFRLFAIDRFNVEDILVNCIYAEALQILVRLAGHLGNTEDARYFQTLQSRVTQAVLDKCYDPFLVSRGFRGC